MHAFKFDTKVLANGFIQFPDFDSYVNQEVEVIILFKDKPSRSPRLTTEEFIQKWAGFLSIDNPDDLKYNYLNEKYK